MDNLNTNDNETFLELSNGAEQDDSTSQLTLAVFCHDRQEKSQDRILAYKWLKVFLSHYSLRSREIGEQMKTVGITENDFKKGMNREDMAEAQRLADEWINANRKTN